MKEEELIERLSQAEALLDATSAILCTLVANGDVMIDWSSGEDLLGIAHEQAHVYAKQYPLPMEKGINRRNRVYKSRGD